MDVVEKLVHFDVSTFFLYQKPVGFFIAKIVSWFGTLGDFNFFVWAWYIYLFCTRAVGWFQYAKLCPNIRRVNNYAKAQPSHECAVRADVRLRARDGGGAAAHASARLHA